MYNINSIVKIINTQLTSNLKQCPASTFSGEFLTFEFLAVSLSKCSRNSIASCCLFVENSGWPFPTKVRNMRGDNPVCRDSISPSLRASISDGALEYLILTNFLKQM